MISVHPTEVYPAVQTLIQAKAASRVHAKDATLYDFSEQAFQCAENFMGWTDLAENPPCPLKAVKKLARHFTDAGMKTAVLIGQGGSTQASMVLTKYFKDEKPAMDFIILDSDSPVRLREAMARCKPSKTVVVVSSKSGGTLEMRLMLSAVRALFLESMNEQQLAEHLVAITDPGSPLAQRALEEGWAGILYGEPAVGGRFSALSVFGLFPAALVGMPLKKMMKRAAQAERLCSADSPENPAIQLAAFLYGNYSAGCREMAFVSPKRGRALGLWIEQLLAESTGKQGRGVLPYLEVDPLLLAQNRADRMAVVYRMPGGSRDAREGFERAVACINPDIPRLDFEVRDAQDLAAHFVMWEYATAFLGYLMQVCPFDQPDVASAKACVSEILETGLPAPDLAGPLAGDLPIGPARVRLSECCAGAPSAYGALKALLGSLKPGDYFAVNAFLPFAGDDRKRALEAIRFAVADKRGVPACLEVGPRFLHSTGQLQKGGPNNGVFLVLSADEPDDIPLVDQPAASLGALAEAQATGDAQVLASRGRRVLHLHLPDNYGITLGLLAALVREVLDDLDKEAPLGRA